MGKRRAGRDEAGRSASSEGRRAQRRATRRGLVTASLILVAAASAVAGWLSRDGWLVGCAVVAAIGAWRWRPEPDPGRWDRGAAAEVATADLLARLPRRFVVFHDRQPAGGRGNIDHLVVGPSGVWVIDSKVRRSRVRIRRGQVWAGDHPIEVAPAAHQAARVGDALGVAVTAVVAVHGTGLRRRGRVVDGVLVVLAERLTRRLRRGRRLSRRDVVSLAARFDEEFPVANGN